MDGGKLQRPRVEAVPVLRFPRLSYAFGTAATWKHWTCKFPLPRLAVFYKWSGWCFSPQTLRSSHAGGLQPTEEPDLSRTWDCTPLPLAGKPATCPHRLHGLCSYLLLLAYSLTQQLRAAAAQSYLDAEHGHRGQSSAGAAPPEGSTVQASRGLSDTAECRWPTSVHTWPLLGPGPPLSWQLEHPEEEEDRPLLNHLWVQEEISREIVSNTLT